MKSLIFGTKTLSYACSMNHRRLLAFKTFITNRNMIVVTEDKSTKQKKMDKIEFAKRVHAYTELVNNAVKVIMYCNRFYAIFWPGMLR